MTKPGQNKVRICMDYTELNKFVMREIHLMATIKHNLATVNKAKILSKVDSISGFWQIPLSAESADLHHFKDNLSRIVSIFSTTSRFTQCARNLTSRDEQDTEGYIRRSHLYG